MNDSSANPLTAGDLANIRRYAAEYTVHASGLPHGTFERILATLAARDEEIARLRKAMSDAIDAAATGKSAVVRLAAALDAG